MSKLKGKLSDNMRIVKENRGPTTSAPGKETLPAPAGKPSGEPSVGRKSARAAVPDSAGEVPQSGNALFPSRVWPD